MHLMTPPAPFFTGHMRAGLSFQRFIRALRQLDIILRRHYRGYPISFRDNPSDAGGIGSDPADGIIPGAGADTGRKRFWRDSHSDIRNGCSPEPPAEIYSRIHLHVFLFGVLPCGMAAIHDINGSGDKAGLIRCWINGHVLKFVRISGTAGPSGSRRTSAQWRGFLR